MKLVDIRAGDLVTIMPEDASIGSAVVLRWAQAREAATRVGVQAAYPDYRIETKHSAERPISDPVSIRLYPEYAVVLKPSAADIPDKWLSIKIRRDPESVYHHRSCCITVEFDRRAYRLTGRLASEIPNSKNAPDAGRTNGITSGGVGVAGAD